MLKVTFLTCAILAWQPLIGTAQAGEAVPGAPSALSLVWTGRFIAVTKAPVLAGVVPQAAAKPARPSTGDDIDIVGSIPVNPSGESGKNRSLAHNARPTSLCLLPGLTSGRGDDLACGGVQHNRWSARATAFNYDLGTVHSDFANAPAPYAAGWE
ncbi:hypothetical protein J8I29_12945 [Labrys sp. LIt4]|uniref:Porin n=1 Tax=Labrys okinawensis TaxID=346911 RepID=A0A2S9QDB9_9HYPH|nr:MULTISPECIES: hypothetical protein [Labrys]MBP0580223.1 hypothetical protein [Labrys sp. LIt4]PRH87344.1 hypothetical protein C5L14_12015 [Labrys okinawensis]